MAKRRPKLDYSGAGKKVKRTTTGLQDSSDAGIKAKKPTTGKKDHFMVCPQVGEEEESFRVETIHISEKSDPYRGKNHQYGGIIIYAHRRERGNWSRPHYNGGYVVIMQTNTDEFEKLQEEWKREPGKVHGIIYKKAFGESCNVTGKTRSCTVDVVGEGFEIMNGEFGTVSSAFNLRADGGIYHDDRNEMSKLSANCVENLVKWWKKARSYFPNKLDHSVQSLLS